MPLEQQDWHDGKGEDDDKTFALYDAQYLCGEASWIHIFYIGNLLLWIPLYLSRYVPI